MRNKKELFKVLLANINQLETGFCKLITRLGKWGFLSFSEELVLDTEIAYERQTREHVTGYLWPKGEKEPRIEWLNQKIREEENNDR